MSSKQSSSALLPPSLQQSQTQLPKPTGGGTARLHSTSTRPPQISVTSTPNIFRSLSTVHRSTSVLPASLLDLDVASTAGLQVIRPDTHPEAFVPVPPDGGWGWVVVFAAFVTNLVIDGICVSFGIMATDLVDHFDAPVATVMLTGSLLLGVYQIVGPVAAGLVNKFGCRAVGIAGSLLATVSMFVSSFMPTIELMLISYGIIAGAAFGFLHLPSIICVSFYFDSRRALAIGITSCGTPLGAMVFAPLTEVLLKKYGWSNTLILFAGMLLNCTVLAALYRPLTPALVLTPMKPKEAEAIKSLLQLATQPSEGLDAGDRVGGTTPFTSQRDLRDQPVIEESEGEAEAASEAKSDSETDSEHDKQEQQNPTQLSTISESQEKEGDYSSRPASSIRLRSRPYRTHQSECRPSRAYLKPIPRQSAVHLAQASLPRRRAESVAMGVLAQSHLSTLGSQLFTSAAGGIENVGGKGMASTLELADGAPVIVELPHESITVEDYARPLYRKDIFFPGSVKRQIETSAASIATAAANVLDPSNEPIGNSQVSMGLSDDLRRRKVRVSRTSQFGSSILFGDNVPLPPINEAAVPDEGTPGDANWTGSCLMSLTKIPLPDVFESKETTSGTDNEAYLWDRLRAETGLNLSDTPADGIYRVPRSHSLCGWWLCWKTQRTRSLDRSDMDAVGRLKRALMEDSDRAPDKRFSRRAHLVLMRKCDFLPKSMCDVLVTMMNLSLLKSKSFLLFCLASLIAMTGAYVPLFFVCDLADSFNIPKSQSAYLLTVYGGASVLSRFSSSWAAGKPNVSATMLSTVTLFFAGCSVCLMPYWNSLIGQIIIMAAFGLAISPFFALTSIILCDILDLEALTNAYGIVTLVRGVASTVGSPLAGMIVSATSTFSIAFILSGATVLIGGFLYVAIILHERAKLNKLIAAADSDHDKI